MTDQPKPLSEQLREIKNEFNDLTARAKDAASRLDRLIWDAEAKERRAELDKTLDEFVPHNYAALKGHDVTLLVAKTKSMGEGYNSRISETLMTALTLSAAMGGHDTGVSVSLVDNGSKWIRLDSDRLDKAREKTENTTVNFAPVAKDIMVSNTPDKATERLKHYIVVTDGNISDNPDHALQMLDTALQLNPKVTIDFINFGTGNVNDLAAKIKAPSEIQKPGVVTIDKPEEFRAALMGVLTGRYGIKYEPPQPQPAPAAEAPKAPEAPKAAEPAKAETPAAEPPKPPQQQAKP